MLSLPPLEPKEGENAKMSYDISVLDGAGKVVEFSEPHGIAGGTYDVDEARAYLNVTYNYGGHYEKLWGHGIRKFDGMTIAEVRPYIIEAVEKLGTARSENYWSSTKGNAGAAMQDLLTIIDKCYPEDVIEIR